MNSASQIDTKLSFPAGIIVLGPNGALGQNIRKSIVDIKGIFTSIVVPLEAGAGRFDNGHWTELDEFDHLTIHQDLKTHLQHKDGGRPLILSPSKPAGLTTPICLASVSAPPASLKLSPTTRHQKQYGGGSAIIGVTPDQTYNSTSTHLFVDIWAIPSTVLPTALPPKWPGARRLTSQGPNQNGFGPIPAPWAFRRGVVPECIFLLMFWLADVPEAQGPIIC